MGAMHISHVMAAYLAFIDKVEVRHGDAIGCEPLAPSPGPFVALDVTFKLMTKDHPRMVYTILLDIEEGMIDGAEGKNAALRAFCQRLWPRPRRELDMTLSVKGLTGALAWLTTELRQSGDDIWTEITAIETPHALWPAALKEAVRLDF